MRTKLIGIPGMYYYVFSYSGNEGGKSLMSLRPCNWRYVVLVLRIGQDRGFDNFCSLGTGTHFKSSNHTNVPGN